MLSSVGAVANRAYRPSPLTVGRGPVPRHAPGLTANVRGLWATGVFRLGESSRGTGPRAT